MKAMQYEGYGGPERIRPAEVPVPRPSESQVLVRVEASSVNPVDWKLHSGAYRWIMPVRFPSIPGFDIAGEVTEVGDRVTRFKPGDRIFAMLDTRPGGASAEYAVVGESAAAPAPQGLSALEAAAIPLAGLTALQALRDLGPVGAGMRVLIVGAAGGVGHFATQIAVANGAHVTAVCGTRHTEMMRALGAERVIDYGKHDDLQPPEQYDFVLDLIVRAPLGSFLSAMSRNGVYVASLPSPSRIAAALTLPLVARQRVRIVGVKPRGEDLAALSTLCASGKLRPVIDREFALAELAAAYTYSRDGHAGGKIVIAVGA